MKEEAGHEREDGDVMDTGCWQAPYAWSFNQHASAVQDQICTRVILPCILLGETQSIHTTTPFISITARHSRFISVHFSTTTKWKKASFKYTCENCRFWWNWRNYNFSTETLDLLHKSSLLELWAGACTLWSSAADRIRQQHSWISNQLKPVMH